MPCCRERSKARRSSGSFSSMSQRQMLFFGAIAAVVGVECARQAHPAAEPTEYSYAFAVPECAPWDGPAVVLYLLDSHSDAVPPATRHVRVAIWKGLDELAHQTFRWPLDQQTGTGEQCSSADSCEPAIEGQIAFGDVERDSSIEGELDVRFATGDRVRQAFKAAWQPLRVRCGF